MKRRQVSTVIAAAALVVSTPAIAQAAKVTLEDKVRDAPPKVDIVRITYHNGTAAFGYRMKVRDLKPRSGVHAFPKILVNGSWDRFFTITSGARRDGTRFHNLTVSSPDANGRVPCPGMTASVDFRADVVTARVPQRCLGDLGRRKFKAVGYVAVPGMQEAADQTRFRWVAYD
jgi:hypothetical protein